MFYQTQLVRLYSGGAIDTQGKRLRFCGNLPVSEGDWVWTDGTVIFGHIPPKGAPNIQDSQGGIPAAFDETKGYFTKTGKFKKYNIAVDEDTPNWIVNGKKKYFHSADRVFDAEIVVENEREVGIWTAEIDGNQGIYAVKGDNILDDDAIVIKKDGIEVDRIYLHDHAKAFDKLQELRTDGYCEGVSGLVGHAQILNFRLNTDGSWDALIASFLCSYLDYSCKEYGTRVEYNYIWRTNGYSLGGTTTVRKDLACFIDLSKPLSVALPEALADYNAKLAATGCKFSAEDFNSPSLGNLAEIILSADGSGGNLSSTVWTDADVESVDPPVNKTASRNISIYYLVHIKSNGTENVLHEDINDSGVAVYEDTITLQKFNTTEYIPGTYVVGTWIVGFGYGTDVWYAPDYARIKVTENRETTYQVSKSHTQNYQSSWQYPIQDGYYVEMNQWRILNIYDPDGNVIVKNIKKSTIDNTAGAIDLIHEFASHRFMHGLALWTLSYTDLVTEQGKSRFANNSKPLMGFYKSSSNIKTSAPNGYAELITRYQTGASYLSYKRPYINLPSVVKISNGYLIGVSQNDIYKVDKDGIATQISDKTELANLRLRYMRNISRARK